MGAEVIESNSNANYSRSLLFQYSIPYYHTGICATYPFADNLSFTGYLYNGWNNVEDNNKQKTVGANIAWSVTDKIQLIGNIISGTEQVGTPTNPKTVAELILNLTASDKLSFVVDGVYGKERQPTLVLAQWKGIALYGKYAMTDLSTFALRGETFNDLNGYTSGLHQSFTELTATYEYKYNTNLLIRLEFRRDHSTESTFVDKNGSAAKDQNTLTFGSMLTF